MTEDLSILEHPKQIKSENKINLPNGLTSEISHYSYVTLKNNIKLKNVLHVGDFKHNLLSITKLVEENMCKVSFFKGFFIITNTVNDEVKGVGTSKNGVYYLQNELMETTLNDLKERLCAAQQTSQSRLVMNAALNLCSITDI